MRFEVAFFADAFDTGFLAGFAPARAVVLDLPPDLLFEEALPRDEVFDFDAAALLWLPLVDADAFDFDPDLAFIAALDLAVDFFAVDFFEADFALVFLPFAEEALLPPRPVPFAFALEDLEAALAFDFDRLPIDSISSSNSIWRSIAA